MKNENLDSVKNNVKLAIVTLIYCLFLAFVIWISASLSSCSSQPIKASRTIKNAQEAELFMLKCKVDNQAALIHAYEDVLHEVWLDKPSYVEDALSEGDAFIELNEIMGENDVFQFRNKQDSIRYTNNWNGGESSW